MTASAHGYTGPELCALSAVEMVALLRKGEVSRQEAIDAALARIAQVDPAVNAIPTLCEDRARAAAEALDGPADHPAWLTGLPIGIKDLTPVAGVKTTYGTPTMAENVPQESDILVRQLEHRGAVVLGKTNTPEFGAGANTFNPVFGRTRNAWDTSKNAAGSSGGAAVSLATGELWLSHGSDHGGSLRTPAAYNGVVGLRPSPGLCASNSPTGFVTGGQQGPMARSVTDCALFLDAMSGFHPSVPSSFPPPDGGYQMAVAQTDGKIRIGFAPDLDGLSPVEPEIGNRIRWALAQMEKNGASVEEACPDLSNLSRCYHVIRGLGFAASFHGASPELLASVKDTIKENIAFGHRLTVADIAEAEHDRSRIFDATAAFLTRFDVLACPTVGNMPRPVELEWVDEVAGTKMTGYMDWLRFAYLATTAGLPAISVPIGLGPSGMPIGLQLIGPPRGEAKLLAAARALEIAVGGPSGPIDPRVTHEA